MSTPPRDGIGGPPPGHHSDHGTGHEEDVLPWRPILIGVAIAAVLLGGAIAARNLIERELFAREARSSAPANPLADRYGRHLPPPPRLQVNPERDLAELRRSAKEILDSYGWVDESAGIVRIPIARAIELLAAQGSEQGSVAAPGGMAAPGESRAPAAPAPDAASPSAPAPSAPADPPAHGGVR